MKSERKALSVGAGKVGFCLCEFTRCVTKDSHSASPGSSVAVVVV